MTRSAGPAWAHSAASAWSRSSPGSTRAASCCRPTRRCWRAAASCAVARLAGSCSGLRSVRAAAAHDCGQRAGEQLEVAPERPVGHVEVVERDHLGERDVAAAHDLPEAGEAGGEVEAAAAVADDVAILFDDQRTRADEAHLAAHDVDELRQLVQRPLAQRAPERRDARVLGNLEHRRAALVVLVEMADLALDGVRVDVHRAELVDAEAAAAIADALLPEEHRAGRLELDA